MNQRNTHDDRSVQEHRPEAPDSDRASTYGGLGSKSGGTPGPQRRGDVHDLDDRQGSVPATEVPKTA
jgi:hypothetical protein